MVNKNNEEEFLKDNKNEFKFPCPDKNYDIIPIEACSYCHKNKTCDIYSFMLDEQYY